jgi:hypothetical protein
LQKITSVDKSQGGVFCHSNWMQPPDRSWQCMPFHSTGAMKQWLKRDVKYNMICQSNMYRYVINRSQLISALIWVMLLGGTWRTYHVKPREWADWAVAASGFQHGEVTGLNGQVWAGPGAKRLHMRHIRHMRFPRQELHLRPFCLTSRGGRTGTDND